jgi:hypothetical protein
MALFQSNACAAFTWDDSDCCQGILLIQKREQRHVIRTWSAQRSGQQTRAQLLESGFATLGVDADTTVLVGGNIHKVCFVDVNMPKMPPQQLRQALRFELSKHTPLPPDELQWNYRVISKIPGSELNLIRMVFLARREWESWIAAASGINSGVDMIVPAAAVCDPLLSGRDICFTLNNEHWDYNYKSLANGEREITTIHTDNTAVESLFGKGPAPLAYDRLELGELEAMDPARQENFTAAVIIAMYGVTSSYWQDRKYWFDVPDEMRPRRNRTLKLITFSLGIYMILLIGFLIAGKFHRDYLKYQSLAHQITNLESEIEQLSSTNTPNPLADELEKQIEEANRSEFSLPAGLSEFTQLTTTKLWATNFNWDAGEMRVELKADIDEPDLTLSLQESHLLTDFTMRKRQLQDQSANYTISCRIKLPEEIASYSPPSTHSRQDQHEKTETPVDKIPNPEPPDNIISPENTESSSGNASPAPDNSSDSEINSLHPLDSPEDTIEFTDPDTNEHDSNINDDL